jgi:2-polyprenyl-6-methoxyphenol hydroxylase-like FAD-dependent oxidoreductase
MTSIHEPARETPVVGEYDLCVVGGSCTGVFAAVRAARLGLSVAIVERNILFGGMATAALVNEWHSLLDANQHRPIIGGLTVEILNRLRRRDAVREMPHASGLRYRFNSAELALELDEIVREHHIRPFLLSTCVAAVRAGDRIEAAIIEDKSGRRAIRARFFIDASGDGDLLRSSGFAATKNETLQPVNYQILAAGLKAIPKDPSIGLWDRVKSRAGEFQYPLENATPWFFDYPAPADVMNLFGARLNGVDASDADQATSAILEGRRRQRALLDMIRSESGQEVSVVALAHALGVRETWHARCLHRLSGKELLGGTHFPDAIGRGTYPIDIHSEEGTLIRHLDGREEVVGLDGRITWRRWRDEQVEAPACYHIPFRCLIPQDADNLLVAGRLLDADREAFGAVRVMVNLNQTGEAAGVAAFLALQSGCLPVALSNTQLRRSLIDGGSLLD